MISEEKLPSVEHLSSSDLQEATNSDSNKIPIFPYYLFTDKSMLNIDLKKEFPKIIKY